MMGSNNKNNLYRCILIILVSAFIKVFAMNVMMINNRPESPNTVSLPIYVEAKKDPFEYDLVDINDFKKPVFVRNEYLNDYIDNYIESNACVYLDYDITVLDEDRIDVYLNCGSPASIIFDDDQKREVPFSDIVTNYDLFIEHTKKLLNMKYPQFVVDNIDFLSSIYDIKKNELIGYFKTNEFGDVNIRINNNEIPELMNYEMHYDDAYENEVYTLDKNKKAIAFTFDDGPSNYDIDIIDSLVKSHSKATFFVVGNRLLNFSKSVNYMIQNDMEVGNHTYDHKSLVKLSVDKVKEEINKTNDIFYNMTNKTLNLLRPSYGAINKTVHSELNMPIILWDVDTLDWKSRNAEKVYEVAMRDIEDGSIVLMHSLYESTKDAVNLLLPALYKEGYQVVTVSELAMLKGVTLTSDMTVRDIK